MSSEGADVDYETGEKVLVFHGPLLYEAKILNVLQSSDSSSDTYKVHYIGWKERWDEEVPKTRVRKYTEEFVQLKEYLVLHLPTNQTQRRERTQTREKEAAPAAEGTPSTPARSTKRRKPSAGGEGTAALEGGGDVNGPGDASAAAVEEGRLFVLPSALKRQLVDDWEFVTKEQKLVSLPREPTVSGVLSAWLHSKSKRGIADKASREIADGLRDYFDEALSAMLLYKFERLQYDQLVNRLHHGDLKPSKIYGAEHLLRLLIKLPTLLESANIEPQKLSLIAERINELAKFLHKNGRLVFLPEYEAADENYAAKASNL